MKGEHNHKYIETVNRMQGQERGRRINRLEKKCGRNTFMKSK
jgi:hypothetical protein